MNSICSVGGDSSIADEVSDVLNSLSPSELKDIDSEDEDVTERDYDSDDGELVKKRFVDKRDKLEQSIPER